MCPRPPPCDDYVPDYERSRAQGHLCFGMGYTPPCKRCGRSGMLHRVSFLSDLEDED